MFPPDVARRSFEEWRERVSRDWLADDPHLSSLHAHHRVDPGDLADFARVCAKEIDPLVRENNRDEHLPILRRWDGQGHRIEAVDHHPTYRDVGRLAYRSGLMTRYGTPGLESESLARAYLFAQNGEAGHACPMACTAGLIKLLRTAGDPRPDWMERLLDPDYDRHYRGAQFLTEVQGGSDVGANAVVARPQGSGHASIHGEKWFCSVIDADLFLMTARPEGAGPGTAPLEAFVVPRRLDDGATNGFRIRRLKYKLGTRSMASAEVDFEGAWALRIADFRQVMEVVIDTSRLYNAVCSTGMMQRAWREADAYARARHAFGQPILAFPTVARIVARLKAEAYGARATTFLLASMVDRQSRGELSARDQKARRMLVNLNKFWTSTVGTTCVREAIEVLGGNGAIEEFSVLPRLLRDSIVCEAWEGGHNVLCAQVLRDAQRLGLHEALFELLDELGAPADRLERFRGRWAALLASPDAAWRVRDLCEELRPLAQGAALVGEERAGSRDPGVAAARAWLLGTSAPGYDAFSDPRLLDLTSDLLSHGT